MPVVFVHGVNNRKSPAYDASRLAIQAFLKRHLAGATVRGKAIGTIDKVWFPYWGDLATDFAYDMASLPQGEMEALGGTVEESIQPLVAHIRDLLPGSLGSEPLITLAKRSLPLAVDVLTQAAVGMRVT
jgi:hypothetical protein